MARIHGFELKNMKTWRGMEDEGCQGTLYLNGVKLGFASYDGNGSVCVDYDLPYDLVEELSALIDAQCPDLRWREDAAATLDDVFYKLHSALYDEKWLRKQWTSAQKKGWHVAQYRSVPKGDEQYYGYTGTEDVPVPRDTMGSLGFNPAAYTDEAIKAELVDQLSKDGEALVEFHVWHERPEIVIGDPLDAGDVLARLKEHMKRRA